MAISVLLHAGILQREVKGETMLHGTESAFEIVMSGMCSCKEESRTN